MKSAAGAFRNNPLLGILLVFAAMGTANAAPDLYGVDLRHTQAVTGNAAAGAEKASVCAACHGNNGISVVPQFPNLAGQSATYLYLQLRSYKNGSRDNAVMQAQVSSLSDADMRDFASYYAGLTASNAALDDTDSPGARLYHEGDPVRGIPACSGCHGGDALGPQWDQASRTPQPAWATFPALHGQHVEYTVDQLKAFQTGSRAGTTNAHVMTGVVEHMDAQDMQALAAYLAGH